MNPCDVGTESAVGPARVRRRRLVLPLILLLSCAAVAPAQQFHRQSFESNETQLRLGLANGVFDLLEHQLVEDHTHSGRRSERLLVRVTGGDFATIEYSFDPTMIIEELEISAFVSASRPGVQIQARVVLPREKDPETGQPLVTLLSGTTYDTTERYRKLVVNRLDKLLARQQQLLQAERKKSIDVREAYVDQVVFNIMNGNGEYDIWVDDIVVGPIVPRVASSQDSDAEPAPDDAVPLTMRREDGLPARAQSPDVTSRQEKLFAEIRSQRLLVGEKAFFPRGLVRSQAPLRVFKETGMNLVFEPVPVAGATMNEAESLGLLVVPMLSHTVPGTSPQTLASTSAMESTFSDRSIFFYLGGPLDRTGLNGLDDAVRGLRDQARAGERPLTGDIAEDIRNYSRKLDMLGTARFPLMTSQTLSSYQAWLRERKALALPGTFLWSWIQTHPPRETIRLAYGHDLEERPFDRPVGPTPDQIRLATYASITAGSRGVVFTSDRWLGESAKGRDRTLGLALLNAELTLLEPFIADGNPPILRPTSHPNIEAAFFRHNGGRGVLAIAYWKDTTSQYVVGQSSANKVQFIVPSAPESCQAFEISPAEVRGVKRQRVVGGTLVQIDEFDTVAFVVLTTDAKLYANYQEMVQQTAETAARWQAERASLTLDATETTLARRPAGRAGMASSAEFLKEAHDHLEQAKGAQERFDHRLAYTLAQRSIRYSRQVQAQTWKEAVPQPATAVSSPYAVSFFTLPEQEEFLERARSSTFGSNALTAGDFEVPGNLDAAGWTFNPDSIDDVQASALLVTSKKPGKGQALEVRVEAKSDPPTVLENTRVQVSSPPVRVEAGQLVRITGSIRIASDIVASGDGVMVWDSAGGESLAQRFVTADDQSFELFRPILESGEIKVHLTMTGLGSVEFDDIQVQVAVPTAANVARQPETAANR